MFEEQHEVLLPPFLKIELEKMELTEKEKQYRDVNGQSPYSKYLVEVKGIRSQNLEVESRKRKVLTPERNQKSAQILKKMVNKEIVTEEEKQEYCLWKEDIRAIIWIRFKTIEQEYLGGDLS